MSAKIVGIRGSTKHTVAQVFNDEIMPQATGVFVCGVNDEGGLRWDASSMEGRDLLWALEKAIHDLMSGNMDLEP